MLLLVIQRSSATPRGGSQNECSLLRKQPRAVANGPSTLGVGRPGFRGCWAVRRVVDRTDLEGAPRLGEQSCGHLARARPGQREVEVEVECGRNAQRGSCIGRSSVATGCRLFLHWTHAVLAGTHVTGPATQPDSAGKRRLETRDTLYYE